MNRQGPVPSFLVVKAHHFHTLVLPVVAVQYLFVAQLRPAPFPPTDHPQTTDASFLLLAGIIHPLSDMSSPNRMSIRSLLNPSNTEENANTNENNDHDENDDAPQTPQGRSASYRLPVQPDGERSGPLLLHRHISDTKPQDHPLLHSQANSRAKANAKPATLLTLTRLRLLSVASAPSQPCRSRQPLPTTGSRLHSPPLRVRRQRPAAMLFPQEMPLSGLVSKASRPLVVSIPRLRAPQTVPPQ